MVGVGDNSGAFLQYVDAVGLSLGCEIQVLGIQPYDALIEIQVGKKVIKVSQKFADQIYVEFLTAGQQMPTDDAEIRDLGLDREGDL